MEAQKILRAVYLNRLKIQEKVKMIGQPVTVNAVDCSRTKVKTSRGKSVVEVQALKNQILLEEIEELQERIDRIMQVIKSVPDETERTLLESYTITGSWKEMVKVFGSPSRLKPVKESALKHFTEQLRKVT